MGAMSNARHWWNKRTKIALSSIAIVLGTAVTAFAALSYPPPTILAGFQSNGNVVITWTPDSSYSRASSIQISRAANADDHNVIATLSRSDLRRLSYVDRRPLRGTNFYSARYRINDSYTSWSSAVEISRNSTTSTTNGSSSSTTNAGSGSTPTTNDSSTPTTSGNGATTTTNAAEPITTTTTRATTTTTRAPITTTTTASSSGSPAPPAPLALPSGLAECPADATSVMLSLVNRDRASQGMGPLTLNANLNWAARAHSISMATSIGLSHTGWNTEIAQSGYISGNGWLAQNVGYITGSYGPSAIEGAFFNEVPPNDGHRKNILSVNAKNIGISCVKNVAENKFWWTQDFGG